MPGAYATTRLNGSTVNKDLDSGDEKISAYAHQLFTHLRGVADQMGMQGGSEADH